MWKSLKWFPKPAIRWILWCMHGSTIGSIEGEGSVTITILGYGVLMVRYVLAEYVLVWYDVVMWYKMAECDMCYGGIASLTGK